MWLFSKPLAKVKKKEIPVKFFSNYLYIIYIILYSKKIFIFLLNFFNILFGT